jgi:hypothetical protein
MENQVDILVDNSIFINLEEDDENLWLNTKLGSHELMIGIRKHDGGHDMDEIDIFIRRENGDIQIARIDLSFLRKILPVYDVIEGFSKNETV